MSDRPRILHPIQVFLDTRQFIRDESKPPRGGNKDFFEGNDAAFARHKAVIRRQIDDVSDSFEPLGEAAAFVIVQMREDALAKSYRPISALFTPGHKFALVGGGGPGEMFFQCTRRGLERLSRLIEEKAELHPREVFNEKTQRVELRASAYRSEVGAIETVRVPRTADKINFSAREAINWLQQPGVIGSYIIELFRPDWNVESEAVHRALAAFRTRLEQLDGGIATLPISKPGRGAHSLAITIQLLAETDTKQILVSVPGEEPSREQLSLAIETLHEPAMAPDFAIERHQELLDFLASEPMVRTVELPPTIQMHPAGEGREIQRADLPPPTPNRNYPVVGILDGGVANVGPLGAWRAGSAGIVAAPDRDEYHGTFIAGLLAGARHLNPHIEDALELSPCRYFDLDILPRQAVMSSYYATIPEFLDQLETVVERAKAEQRVRVFNMSLGISKGFTRLDYSPFAAELDQIARRHDVIFVVSAGNLTGLDARPPWPADADEALEMLATRPRNADGITPPAEHLYGLTVGAINPPGVAGHEPDAPTTYTRRGPGAGSARKPELCHYGGVRPTRGNETGLFSIAPDGAIVADRGTSFSTPLVAATVAGIDNILEGTARRETLLALPVHRAKRPQIMLQKPLRHVSRDFVGFGLPPPSNQCLADDPHSVTLVFSEVLMPRRELEFAFTWPRSLVSDDGKCRGSLDLTLGFTPPVDPQFHSECVRARLEAHVYQLETDDETGEEVAKSQLTLEDSGLPQSREYTERYLVETGLKWTPIKRYHLNMPKGRGSSSEWRLSLKSYTRAGAAYPVEGVPFTIIMTMSDPTGIAAVFDEVRNDIVRRGLRLADITVAHRVRP